MLISKKPHVRSVFRGFFSGIAHSFIVNQDTHGLATTGGTQGSLIRTDDQGPHDWIPEHNPVLLDMFKPFHANLIYNLELSNVGRERISLILGTLSVDSRAPRPSVQPGRPHLLRFSKARILSLESVIDHSRDVRESLPFSSQVQQLFREITALSA